MSKRHERDYLETTIATVRQHRNADNCWPQWANIFADEIEALWKIEDARAAEDAALISGAAEGATESLRGYLEEIKRLASDPWASEAVALRACLLAAYEGLGLPGPEDSPLRQTARAILAELEAEADGA